MRTSNPALRDSLFRDAGYASIDDRMTVEGTINKLGILLILLLTTGVGSWTLAYQRPEIAPIVMIGGAVGGLIVAMVGIFKHSLIPYMAPAYALLEGLLLGGLSALLEQQYPGIASQAMFLTMGTAVGMFLIYKSGVITVNEKFRTGVMMATVGIFFAYAVSWIMSIFGLGTSFVFSASPLGIGFSVLVVGIAALNLMLDFDFIERGANQGIPARYEWYGAFGLLITLVWLYIEILRLLSKLNRR